VVPRREDLHDHGTIEGVSDVPPEISRYLSERHPELLDLALWVRQLVLEAEPDLAERLYRGWDGIGFRHPAGGYVCAIYPRDDEVRLLFEHGARLKDPDRILQGEGSQTRFIPITKRNNELAAVLQQYVNAAVAERLFRP
jgi:hypothetical protein